MVGKIDAYGIRCEDGRLLGSNVPSVNIYISAAIVKVCVSVPLSLYDLGMYSHTYIHPNGIANAAVSALCLQLWQLNVPSADKLVACRLDPVW